MDYRLVKQYLNSAVDNFFNFFYKTADFLKVLGDMFWAFMEIWYNFFMFFANIALYLYYLFLYIIDRMTISSAPIFFWKRSGASTRQDFSKAYSKGGANPVSGMYGGRSAASAVSSPLVSAGSAIVDTVSKTGGAVSSSVSDAASAVVASKVSTRPNIFLRVLAAIGAFIASIFKGIFGAIASFWRFLISKLIPVKEQPVGRKDLVSDYMQQYEKNKYR